MSVRLLFITSHYFLQPTIDSLSRLDLPCETRVVPYDDFHHIAQVYGELADQYDACFTSGIIAKQAIELVYPNPQKPLVHFQTSPNALHRDILKVILDTGNMDLQRIAMDFLIPLNMGYSVADFLKIDQLDDVYEYNAHLTRQIGAHADHTIETVILERISRLWEMNAIDLVICQYSSILPQLEARGIPYRCSPVSDHQLNRVIRELLTRLELQKLHDNHPVIIQVFPRQSGTMTAECRRLLREQIQQYIKNNLLECILQDNEHSLVLISSMKILRVLTDDFQNCRLSAYLEGALPLPVLVGYGVGTTVIHAMNNVQIASREAKIVGKSFVVDSQGCLIGPLNSQQHTVVSSHAMPNVSEIAKRCNLSAMTIHRVITILRNDNTDKITTQNLALRLDTTIRNANRIMQNLCRGGVATPVYTQVSHSRGRPIQVYCLNFDAPGHV